MGSNRKLGELQSEIWSIWQILVFAKECFQYSYYLHKPDSKEEVEYLQDSRDFQFIAHTLWRSSVIELSKLFTNDRFSINRLINKLKIDGHFAKMNISEEMIKSWEAKLLINQSTINDIIVLRDKVYAHTDSNKDDYTNVDLTFESTKRLITLVESIIFDIHTNALNVHPIMETPVFPRGRFDLIKILAQEKVR